MDQFPTEEEEFELRYQEEMEMVDDFPDEIVNTQPTPGPSKRLNSTQYSQKTILHSPSLSQIYPGSPTSTIDGDPGPVNRRLFGTPGTASGPKRFASTPFYGKTSKIQRIEEVLEDVEEIEEVSHNGALNELQKIGTNKRKLNELFGDDSPRKSFDSNLVYGDDTFVDREAKKAKQEEERDLELIEKIMETRKKMKEGNSRLKNDIDRLNALHDYKMRNLSYTIPNYPFLPIVKSNTDRIYIRFHSEEYEKKHIDEVRVSEKGFSGLLGDQKEEIWATAREITVKRMTALEAETEPDVVEIPSAGLASDEGNLWVDKYKPRKYTDLLSDESTNRTLLYWVKMWDKVVFGKDFRKPKTAYEKQQQNLNSFNKRTGRFEQTGGWKNRKSRLNLNTEYDEHDRPIQKIALLSGPPGLGKTTLAHTIARHAGYKIRELNASDDRNPEAFKLTLENGTQMSSVLDLEKRPNCIILDEIDGAPQASIDFLMRFINDSAQNKPAKKGVKEANSILKRPIICICNDLYAPALRQLRQVAFVVNFPPIETAKLAERLLEIANQEGLQTDLMALMALADKTGNDVRSCISLMQFFNATKSKLVLTDVLNSNFGTKDRNAGLFEVWGSIFQIKRPQKRLETNNNNEEAQVVMTNMSAATRMNNVLAVVHSGGDYERLMQGVYENFLHQKMPDPNLTGVTEAIQWFCFSDILNQQINHLQNYTLYGYLQFPFVIWHLLFASLAWPKINFPHQGVEFNQKMTTTKMLFQAFRKGISSGVIGAGQGSTLLTETVPFLKRILSPHLRSVSVQLLSPKEKYDLTHTVEIMADFGLVYNQLKKPDGMYEYNLEPDLNIMCKFNGYPGITLAYFGKQLIAKEVESETLRRMAPKASGPVRPNTNQKTIKTTANHLQTLKPRINEKSKGKEVEKKVSKDFFGRRITATSSTSQSDGTRSKGGQRGSPSEKGVIKKSPIWYKYKEGFNNAVRKDVFMHELL